MHSILQHFNIFDCSCWQLGDGEYYCTYCDATCEAGLEEFECAVGDWLLVGDSGGSIVGQGGESPFSSLSERS